MPLKVNIGLSKKVGLPDYGSLGASCHVEYEADSTLLHGDLETFHRQVQNAFIACKQAVQDELHRQLSAESPQRTAATNQPHSEQQTTNVHTNGSHRNGSANGQASNNTYGSQRRGGRKATTSQVRALEAISNRLQLDLNQWLRQKYGLAIPADLTIKEASQAIDELNASASQGANGVPY